MIIDGGETAEITRVTWLRNQLDFQKQGSSIIIEFTTPQPANAAIHYGVNWDSRSLIAEKYNHDARIKQCYHCQQFGHIGIGLLTISAEAILFDRLTAADTIFAALATADTDIEYYSLASLAGGYDICYITPIFDIRRIIT
jgi:hypothetical protein